MILPRLSQASSLLWRLILAFAVLSVILNVVGMTVYEHVADSNLKWENEQLGAIAEFKKDQLATWLDERRGDILVYMDSPVDAAKGLRVGFGRYLTKPYDLHYPLRAVADELVVRPDEPGSRSSNIRIGTTVRERGVAA